MDLRPAEVVVTIDTLVVEGMDGASAQRLGMALREGLTRRLQSEGVPRALQEPSATRDMSLSLDLPTTSGTPEALGDRLAHRLFERMGLERLA